jgi:hypothetical protein
MKEVACGILPIMPTHSFMLADIRGSLVAVCLFPLFVLVPGYAVAWLTGLFEFRRRTTAFQLALSIPLSIAICPVATYLAGRFGSLAAVWCLYAAAWAYALVVLVGRARLGRPPVRRQSRLVPAILAGWAAVAILSLVDLQIGARAYFPAAASDYSIRVQFIHAIGATGIPPGNPFFLPGHPVPIRYHYFWLLLCAMVHLAGGSLVSPRHAWIGGTVWCGFGFMALIALYFRLFSYRGPASFRRRAITGVLLTGVTGLDILPIAVLWMLQAAGMHGVLPSGEWWNEQVDGFVYTALWESHYLSSLIACLVAFLVLWHAASQPAIGARIRYVLIAGLALASAGGASVYVAFVFAIFLLVWTAAALAQRRWREAAVLAAAGLAGLAFLLPYALSLRSPAQGGPLLGFWMRPFYPVDALFKGQAIGSGWARALANGLALPLNYFLELGFFLAAALLWWKKHRATHQPLTRAQAATALMIATSVITCTFLRSAVIGNNDLGWRGFLIAQFGLLLWAVDVVSDWGSEAGRDQRGFLTALLVLGAAGSVYEVAINRFYPLLADHGTVATVSWLAPDRQAGKRNYAQREAGEWAARAIPRTAVVEFNPHVASQNTSTYLYAERQILAADTHCLSIFGGDPALCPALIAALNPIYPLAGQTALPTLDSVCRSLPIDLIGAIDTDPAWSDRRSWVWTQPPAFANRYVRLFRCQPHF